MATLQELLAQRIALDAEITQTQASQKAAAIAQVRALMADFNLTAADLGTTRVAKVAKVSKVAIKYRNIPTGETWSGRGLQPKWLKAAIAEGALISDFLV
jgi:DNA-binding protein H-NS